MLVKAIKVGFYGELRKLNSEFEITSKKDLGSWMKPVVKARTAKEELAKE